MSAWPNIYDSPVTADTPIVTTTETVAATVVVPAVPGPGARIKLTGFAQVTAGTATTALTMRIRRGTDATGTLVGEGNPIQGGVAAGSTSEVVLEVTDTPAGEVAQQSYVVTVQQTAATANGSIVQASLRATV